MISKSQELPAPYYSSEDVTIYCGDCRNILPHLSWNIAATDPPYGMRYRSNYRIVRHGHIEQDGDYPHDVLGELIRGSSHATYAFCRWETVGTLKPKSCIAWVKNNWSMGDLRHEHGRQWEACMFWPGPHHTFTKRIPDVLTYDRQSSDRHPTEKPVGLMAALISCNVGEVVLDPFSGSGTTLVAARLEGRKSIGVEINERYCEAAAKRLEQRMLI